MDTNSPNAYARAGVDTDIEAEASNIMYQASKRTWDNRKGLIGEVQIPFDDFSGVKLIDISNLPSGSYLNLHGDGTGTKPTTSELVDLPETLGEDLIAMVADDAVKQGAEPGVVFNHIDLTTLGTDRKHFPRMQRIAEGLVNGANKANVAVINGEIAQMGSRIFGYGEFPFNWSAACVWFVRKDRIITGSKVCVGDRIVLFKEHGFRCNGLSLVQRTFKEAYGAEWYKESFGDSTLGMQVLLPSKIYTRAVIAAHGGFATDGECEIHGIAHITGGGIPEKLGRLLRASGLGAELTDLFEMPPAMRQCQVVGSISDRDMYSAVNGGQGMAVITPENNVDQLIACARRFDIEAKDGGHIVTTPGIRLTSKGIKAPGTKLTF